MIEGPSGYIPSIQVKQKCYIIYVGDDVLSREEAYFHLFPNPASNLINIRINDALHDNGTIVP